MGQILLSFLAACQKSPADRQSLQMFLFDHFIKNDLIGSLGITLKQKGAYTIRYLFFLSVSTDILNLYTHLM